VKQMIMIITCILVPLATSAGEASSSLVNSRAPEFALQDQYDKPATTRQWEGSTVVLIGSDKEGSEQNFSWRKTISERYGDLIVIQGIADVRSVPFFLKSRIKKDFQKNKTSILLDWDGVVFKSLDLKKSVSNIVLIDKNCMVRYIQSGPADPGSVSRLFREIDSVAK